jgi:hypothetical protein
VDAGDDLNALDGLRHRCAPRREPGPPGYAACPVELGAAPPVNPGRLKRSGRG